MLRQPTALWPDAMIMLGDQLYADQPPKNVREIVGPRKVHEDAPVESLEDFEEYTVGYRDIWTYPVVRWLLSTLPTSMIFDDHEISNEWKRLRRGLTRSARPTGTRVASSAALMAYWVYQHLGNLSPSELADDEAFGRLSAGEDGSAVVRDLAERAERSGGPLALQLLQRSRPGPARRSRFPGRPAARGRQPPDHEPGGVGLGQGQGGRRAEPPAHGQLAADVAALRDA